MKILALVTEAFGGYGGIATFNRNLLGAFCASHRCTEVVCVPRLQGGESETLPSKLKLVTSGLYGKRSFLRAAGRAAFVSPRPDLILCGHLNLLPVAYGMCLITGSPLWLVIHGTDAWEPASSFLVRRLVRRVDRFLSISAFTRDRFLGWSRVEADRCTVFPNCVDFTAFTPGPADPGLLKRYGLEGKRVLLTVCRLEAKERWKGIDEVLQVLPDVVRSEPSLAYLIVGDGTDRQRLENKAAALGLAGRVVFAGKVAEEEKADHFRLADAYVMPGTAEGFGIVYLEAMACGIPVMGSISDGSREALRQGELGVLVDPRKLEEVRAGILQILRRPKGTRPPGLEYFDYERFQDRAHELLDTFAWRKRGPALRSEGAIRASWHEG